MRAAEERERKKEGTGREKGTGGVAVEVLEVAKAAAAPPPPAAPAAAPAAAASSPSLKEAFAFLAASPQIRCLAIMALSQVRVFFFFISFFFHFFAAEVFFFSFENKNTHSQKTLILKKKPKITLRASPATSSRSPGRATSTSSTRPPRPTRP